MKRFKVRVDNQMFYVEVEEIPGEGAVAVAPAAAPAAAPRAAAPAAPKAAPQAAPKPAAAPAGGGGEGLKAPMPGTILGVKCEVGQQVKVGDVLIILEAMKMENELQADRDGVVQDIRVQKGQAVNAGEVLVIIG
ncbi:MAG: biotin/lipoyl-binding protein [Heliobacteriaceae bacterium]|nr:biotin/lipoyl-binding protein [Heliobacteriaceae bacterium]MDD4588513.1 biotin/lipoyl-binding protein [Heliobacteriaceae bacterium]